jgi:hypothetical protein
MQHAMQMVSKASSSAVLVHDGITRFALLPHAGAAVGLFRTIVSAMLTAAGSADAGSAKKEQRGALFTPAFQVPASRAALCSEQSHRTCICDKDETAIAKFSKLTGCAMALLRVMVLTMQVAEVLPTLLQDRTTAISCQQQQQPAASLGRRQLRSGRGRCDQHRSALRPRPSASISWHMALWRRLQAGLQ